MLSENPLNFYDTSIAINGVPFQVPLAAAVGEFRIIIAGWSQPERSLSERIFDIHAHISNICAYSFMEYFQQFDAFFFSGKTSWGLAELDLFRGRNINFTIWSGDLVGVKRGAMSYLL